MAAAPAEPSRSALAMSSSEVLDIPRGRSLVNASLKGVNREEKCVIWRGIVSRAATAAAVLKLHLCAPSGFLGTSGAEMKTLPVKHTQRTRSPGPQAREPLSQWSEAWPTQPALTQAVTM